MMTLEQIFSIYNVPLTENGVSRKLSDVIEDIYLNVTPDKFKDICILIGTEEPENNIFEEFREKFEE